MNENNEYTMESQRPSEMVCIDDDPYKELSDAELKILIHYNESRYQESSKDIFLLAVKHYRDALARRHPDGDPAGH